MKTLNFTLVFICVTNLFFTISAQNVYIPDPIFKALLVSDSNINTNGDTAIQVTEAANYSGTIDVSDHMNIKTLTGISSFTSISSLNCSNNKLTNLDLSKNTLLDVLICSTNQLTSLNLSKNTALVNLHCEFNQLTNLDLSNNTALNILYCSTNQLTSLDLSNNSVLTYLDCSTNKLTNLDLSNNKALTTLSCFINQLTSLNVSKNTVIEELHCQLNQLTSLDISNIIVLTNLSCSTNQLTNLDVSKNIALSYLSCGENQLTSLNLSNNIVLLTLDCSINQLSSLDLSNNIELTTLDCSTNQLISLNVKNGNNTTLDFIALSNTNLKCIEVDNVSWSETHWTVASGSIDATASFSTNCGYILSDTISFVNKNVSSVDTLKFTLKDTCFLNYYVSVDTVFIASMTKTDSIGLFQFVFVQGNNQDSIMTKININKLQQGANSIYLTIDCLNNNKKNIFIVYYNINLTGTQKNLSELKSQFYPNPFTYETTLYLPSNEIYKLTLIDQQGRLVKEFKNLNNNKVLINSEGLVSGFYYYTLTNQSNSNVYKGKIAINK